MNPVVKSIGRRALLQSLGLGAAVATQSPKVQAQTAAPRRILFFYTENGTLQSLWKPKPKPGETVATENSFQLGDLHRDDLAVHQKKLIYLENVDMISTDLDVTPFGGSHQRMQVHMLTGAPRLRPEVAGTASLDQMIAKSINSPSPTTAFPSLQYSAVGEGYYGEQLVSWSGAGQFLRPEVLPTRAYDFLFKNFVQPKPGEPDQSVAKRKMVYDVLKAQYGDASARMGRNDKLKIDAHASLLSDLQSALSLMPKLSCTKPDRSTAVATPILYAGQGKYEAGHFDRTADFYKKLVTTAFACDLTRVATIELGGWIPADITGYDGDIHLGRVHSLTGERDEADLRSRNGFDNIWRYHKWYAKQFASLLGMLDSVPDGLPGQTLLDNTVVFWFSPMGNGGHDPHYMPYVLAGSGGGHFRTGRYLKYERRQATAEERAIDAQGGDKSPTPMTRGVPHNNLLVSLANYMGLNINTIGNPKCCTGPLERL